MIGLGFWRLTETGSLFVVFRSRTGTRILCIGPIARGGLIGLATMTVLNFLSALKVRSCPARTFAMDRACSSNEPIQRERRSCAGATKLDNRNGGAGPQKGAAKGDKSNY